MGGNTSALENLNPDKLAKVMSETAMRGLKKMETLILKGYQLFHNYIRPHDALDGKTPAEKCGIRLEGDNKWITLIQNSSQTTT